MTTAPGPAGMPLAPETTVASELLTRTSDCDAVWRDHRNQFFVEQARPTSRVTLVIGCTVQLVAVGLFWAGDLAAWRLAALVGLYAAFAIAHLLVLRPVHDPRHVERAFIRMNVVAQLFVVGSAAVTGGLHSPFLPSLVLPSIVALLFFGPYPVARWTAVSNGLLILGLVFLPASVTGAPVPPTHYALLVMLSIGWHLFMLHLMVGKLTAMSNRAGDSMAFLREERISEAIAQLGRLQSVGAKVAHELKNPLAAIKGLCQLVARTPESERTQERLAVVASEISRMETILAEYLSFSRPLEDLKPEQFDLTKLARNVLDIVAGRADQAGVALDLEGGSTAVHGDPRRLKEALINLVSNAIEATPTGGKVTLRLRSSADGVTLEVADTGRGISDENLERMGTSFFTTRPNGTGLGVVLAQSVITQHGGTLGYQSEVGAGTTATIQLPATAHRHEALPRPIKIEARA